MARANVTTDHQKIQRWAEQRGGSSATVRDTETNDEPGILRLDFDPPDETLEKISWEEFFDKFEDSDLAFLYQDKTANGKISRFHKFVDRNSMSDDEEDLEEEEEGEE